jgi:transposase
MKHPHYSVGIDIAAADFTVSISTVPGTALQGPRVWANHPNGFKGLLCWLKRMGVTPSKTVVCMEATGVYGERLCSFLHQHHYPLAVESPLKVKRAFKIDGHKTDAVDSLQIAAYALRFFNELSFWHPPKPLVEQIKVLLTSRELLVKHKTALTNYLQALNRKANLCQAAVKALENTITVLKERIHALEKQITQLLDQDTRIRQTVDLLKTSPGVQQLLAAHMVVLTRGFTSDKDYRQYASYLRIAPLQHQSGSSIYTKPRCPHYGPSLMRKLLHLAARSVVTHTVEFKQYYLRKQAEGKEKRLILNNVENKLLKILCAIIRDQKPFIPHYCSVNPRLLKTA